MDLVGIEEITNIRWQVCEFESEITMSYVQSASICLVNNAHDKTQIPQYTNLKKLVKWAQHLQKVWDIFFFCLSINI